MTRAIAVAVFAGCMSGVVFAQSSAPPEFDVASIRASNPDLGLIQNSTPNLNTDPGRNLNFANISIRDLIMLAYGVGARQISGPDWLTNRFDVVAKVPADASKAQIPLMLRALLAQRFKLTLHRDQKVMQIYALEVAKNGLKLQESAAGDNGESGCQRSFAERPGATLAAVGATVPPSSTPFSSSSGSSWTRARNRWKSSSTITAKKNRRRTDILERGVTRSL